MSGGRVVLFVGGYSGRASELRQSEQWRLEHVETAKEAMEQLGDVDCVVTEQALPDGTGLALCESVRTQYPDLPVVFVPETGSDDLARQAVAAGVDEYVPASTLDDPTELRDVVARDITEHRDRQRELELYETMLNAVPDMVYAIDDSGQFLAVNETFEEETNLTRSAVLGRHVSLGMSEEDVRKGRELVRDLLTDDDREKAIYETEFWTAGGDPIPVENHIALLGGDDGEFRGSVGVLRDISDRQRRKRRLTVLNRALRHDLRNSMHVILANAELVERAVSDPDVEAKLQTIQRRAEDINGLSEKAREIEQTIGERTLPRRNIDLASLLSDQIVRFRDRYPDATIDADIPDHAWVEAVELVDVAVENLIENSLEHTEDQHAEVSVDVAADTVTVTVTDNGPGIPAKERRVVSQGSETPLDHASGLGLWLVAWITRDSGGDVVFETDADDGSAVRLVFDRATPDADRTATDPGPAAR